ncbi:hypothetical protein DYB36_007872 [Aphanomyces astaci]|uniref:Glucose-6-phosphate isomerase n=1 Tax=Aphanomyces astaci TaxID=112090 RepID=A0A397AH20_APHAT|nr:hypothetical protein DYB36_007872 [Aphanomyces astaci]
MTINETSQWQRLTAHAKEIKETTHLKTLLKDEARNAELTAEYNGIHLDYSRQNATTQTLDLLFDLADAAQLRQKLAAMAAGEHINTTEDRAVMHIALRSPANKPLYVDGVNVVDDVHHVLRNIRAFSDKVRTGAHVGATGKHLTNVVSIGIGGSYLGPEYVFEALKHEPVAKAAAAGRTLRFLANVDPVDAARAIEGLDPEHTLVIIVSKTFTTAETMLNARTLRDWLVSSLAKKGVSAADAIRQHIIAVSAAVPKAEAFGINAANVFGFWDWVGGRYSVCSAVGIVPLAIHYGADITDSFLAGAHDIDTHLLTAPLRSNLPVLLGLLGAILPYAQALLRFAAHIQQVDMESNGKRVDLAGVELPFQAGEINFGEPGTNGQHSFYQLIHQGRVVPCDFIGFCKSQTPVELAGEAVSNHDELMSNFFAQPDALANGKSIDELTNFAIFTLQPMDKHEEDTCTYTYKTCGNQRTIKRDGSFHRFCEFHRKKANALQKAYATKRRRELHSLRELVKQSVQVGRDCIDNNTNNTLFDLDEVEPIALSSQAAGFSDEEFAYLCLELQLL